MGIFKFLLNVMGAGIGTAYDGGSFRCKPSQQWTNLLENISLGYEQINTGRIREAHQFLSKLSIPLLKDVNAAFDCSIGVAALYFAISRTFTTDIREVPLTMEGMRSLKIGLRILHCAMNWLTHAFVVGGRAVSSWIDESAWPISVHGMNEEETLILKLLDTNGGRAHAPAWPDAPLDFRDHELRIAIVSVCDYPPENPLPRLSHSNRAMYAKHHGYTLIETTQRFDADRPHAWAKITLMKHNAMSADLDWLIWFDCDTYFMNFNITLDHLLFKYGSKNIDGTRRLDENFKMLVQEDHAMLNTGVFFMRTGQWAHDILEQVYGSPSSPWIHHPWWENAAFTHLFLGDLPQRVIYEPGGGHEGVSDGMGGIYPSGIVVAEQYEFNSYHPITSRLLMHDNWEAGKFVLAFSGCKSGSSQSVVNALYISYYLLMCDINGIKHECVTIDEI